MDLILLICVIFLGVFLFGKYFLFNDDSPKKRKEDENYYVMDIDNGLSVPRKNILSKSRKTKRGGAAHNYRKRTSYEFLFLGADTNEDNELGIMDSLSRIKSSLLEKTIAHVKSRCEQLKTSS